MSASTSKLTKPAKKNGRPLKITPELIGLAEAMLARRFHKHDVKHVLKLKGLQARSCETVISRAKANLVAATGKSKEEHQLEAYRFYDTILRDRTVGAAAKIKAQSRIDKLLGLESPTKIEFTGKDGTPIEGEVTHKFDHDQFARLFTQIAGAGGGGDGKPSDRRDGSK